MPHVPWQGNPGGCARAARELNSIVRVLMGGPRGSRSRAAVGRFVCVCVCVCTPVTVQACTHQDGGSRGALAGLARDAGAGLALTRGYFLAPELP